MYSVWKVITCHITSFNQQNWGSIISWWCFVIEPKTLQKRHQLSSAQKFRIWKHGQLYPEVRHNHIYRDQPYLDKLVSPSLSRHSAICEETSFFLKSNAAWTKYPMICEEVQSGKIQKMAAGISRIRDWCMIEVQGSFNGSPFMNLLVSNWYPKWIGSQP